MSLGPIEILLGLLSGAGGAIYDISQREDVQTHDKELVQKRREAEADLIALRGDIESDLEELRQRHVNDRSAFEAGIKVYLEQNRMHMQYIIAEGDWDQKKAERELRKNEGLLNRALTQDIETEKLALMRQELDLRYPKGVMSGTGKELYIESFRAIIDSGDPTAGAMRVLPTTYAMAQIMGERGVQDAVSSVFKMVTGKDIDEHIKSTHIPEPEVKTGAPGTGFPQGPEPARTAQRLFWDTFIDPSKAGQPRRGGSAMSQPPGASAPIAGDLTIQQLLSLVQQSQQRQLPTNLQYDLTGR